MKLISNELYELLETVFSQEADQEELNTRRRLDAPVELPDWRFSQLTRLHEVDGLSLEDLLETGVGLVWSAYCYEESSGFLGHCQVGRYGSVTVRREPVPQSLADRQRYEADAIRVYERENREHELNDPGSTPAWSTLRRDQQDEYVWRAKRQAAATS